MPKPKRTHSGRPTRSHAGAYLSVYFPDASERETVLAAARAAARRVGISPARSTSWFARRALLAYAGAETNGGGDG